MGSAVVTDSFTEQPMGSAPISSTADVDQAVEAAASAQRQLADVSRAERAAALRTLGELTLDRSDELATIWAREAGMPIAYGRPAVQGLPLATVGALTELLESDEEIIRLGSTQVVKEPVGVVAAITPWNYPFSQAFVKVATAIAAGCAVVLKPSELAPTSAFVFADMMSQLPLPVGTFNLVSGDGPRTGEALVAHIDIAAVSFTGSTATGRRIMELASARVKRVTLELGGKSAMLVLDEESLEAAVAATLASCSRNNGQTCTSLTRLLVPSSLVSRASEMAASIADGHVLGDPLEESTTLGPLVSAQQRDRVRSFIESGIEQGARLVTGGLERPSPSGYFVLPTVFSEVEPWMRIAREEIFGPVLSILGFADIDDAVALANGTDYGLAASVWSSDVELAHRTARRLRAGTISINDGVFNPAAPYGGFDQSGLGRELGRWGVDEFMEWKAIHLPT
jgi:acyl-CoA reductase-like NAD-dependent aldehyde dehydrogenase